MSGFRTRPARAADEAAVVALLQAAGLFAQPTPRLAGFVVAEEGGVLLACAAAERHGAEALLRSVAAATGARRGGLGAALAEAALAAAAREGARTAWLLTETSEAYFAKRGFERVERQRAPDWIRAHPQWTQQCAASAILMRREPASPDRLFVYGTLRSGSPVAAARRLHAAARSLGPACAPGRRVELGAYPGLLDAADAEVEGESFLLPTDCDARDALLAALDAYEGIGPAGESGLPFRREVRFARDAAGIATPHWLYLWRGEVRSGEGSNE